MCKQLRLPLVEWQQPRVYWYEKFPKMSPSVLDSLLDDWARWYGVESYNELIGGPDAYMHCLRG